MENETATKSDEEVGGQPVATVTKPRAKRKTAAKKSPARKPAKSTGKKPAEALQARPASKLVIFLRHGIAEDSTDQKPDGERSLTTSGHDRTKRSARGLSKVVGRVDAILSSPLLRALQTALWVTKAYGGKAKVQTTEALLPEGPTEGVMKLIREAEGRNLVLVGHEPSLSKCAARLLGAPAMKLNLRRAGCIAILVDEDGQGTLECMLAPRTLRGL